MHAPTPAQETQLLNEYCSKLEGSLSGLRSAIAGEREAMNRKLHEERRTRVNEYARVDGLVQWMRNPKRSSASSAFTEGPERQVAYAFEDALRIAKEAACKK
jgi:hypothetical protein